MLDKDEVLNRLEACPSVELRAGTCLMLQVLALVEIREVIADRLGDIVAGIQAAQEMNERWKEEFQALQQEEGPEETGVRLVDDHDAVIDRLHHQVNALKDIAQAQETKLEMLKDRLDANERAVQSCLSTLGELNKVVRALAEKP